MIDVIKEIILDFQSVDLPIRTQRHLNLTTVPGKATVCMGVRRSGKSTFMQQIMKLLSEKGVAKQNILHLNFFDDRLHGMTEAKLGNILEAYYSLFPEKKNAETVYFFFDEIQVVPNWESFVDRVMRTEKCEVYITGSSAQMLSKEISTQMRGRALSWELFPFSFREYLDHYSIDAKGTLTSKTRMQVQKAFEEYWEAGSFPEVLSLDRRLRIKIHQEYLQAVLFRDLIERHDISHPKGVTDLAHWLINNAGSTYTINSLTGYLKSLGHKIPKTSVAQFLEWFEDAYFLFTTRIFDASLSRSNANPKKIYCIDHAMIRSISSGIMTNAGHLLENLVFLALRRVTPQIYYVKTKSGKEVDFIVQTPNQRMLVQVAETIVEPKTRKREITALSEAMAEFRLTSSTIVTRQDEEKIQVPAGIINVVPAWRFLLDVDLPD